MTNEELDDGVIRTFLSTQVYPLEAIQNAAYRIADACTVVFGLPNDESLLPITFTFRPLTSTENAREAVRRFHEDLLDQTLRLRVARETSSIRALLLAQAFSKTDLVRRT